LKAAPRVIKTLYTEDQLRLLLTPPKNISDFNFYEMYVIVHFILNTGCRIRNVVDLQMKDITRLEEGIVRFGLTKNGKPQLIFVPAATVAVLKKFINVWRSDANSEDYVFCNQYGAQSTRDALTKRYEAYVKKVAGANCPTSFHLLRHQYAATFLKKGGSIYDLKRQLGHSSFAMVQWYADHYADPNIENMERFTPSFNFEKGKKLQPKIKK
jgi:integrase/recombinase XerD